jgi:hypothetical protein
VSPAPAPVAAAAVAPPAADQNRLTAATVQVAAPAYVPAAVPVAAAPAQGPAAQADAFEPPPTTLGAAQNQARQAGALTPGVAANGGVAPVTSAIVTTIAPAAPTVPAAANAQPDPIDAAADAFEPPPPAAATAERQAARAGSVALQPAMQPAAEPVQIMRASTAGTSQRAPTQSSDDPIARFANGSY